jgi:hypothetical protein
LPTKNPRKKNAVSTLPTKIREKKTPFLPCRQKSVKKKRRFYLADKNPRKKNAVSTLPTKIREKKTPFLPCRQKFAKKKRRFYLADFCRQGRNGVFSGTALYPGLAY